MKLKSGKYVADAYISFITMSSLFEAQSFVSQMHRSEVFGQTLKVDKPKEGRVVFRAFLMGV